MGKEHGTAGVADVEASSSGAEPWEQSTSDAGFVVRLRGDLTIRDASRLHSRAMSTLGAKTVLHLDEVTYIDAAAAQILYAWRRSLRLHGFELEIVGTPPSVRDELASVGLSWVLGQGEQA